MLHLGVRVYAQGCRDIGCYMCGLGCRREGVRILMTSGFGFRV